MIVTETKMLRHNKRALWKNLRGYGYRQYHSMLTEANDPQAGVLIMVQNKYSDIGTITPLPTPNHLQGYLQALQIRLPTSTPLDIVGIYMPTDQPGARMIRYTRP